MNTSPSTSYSVYLIYQVTNTVGKLCIINTTVLQQLELSKSVSANTKEIIHSISLFNVTFLIKYTMLLITATTNMLEEEISTTKKVEL